jgi:hypothetical protein
MSIVLPLLAAHAVSDLAQRVFSPRLVSTTDAQATSVARLRRFFSEEEMDRFHDAAAVVCAERGEMERSNGCAEGSWRTVYLNNRLADLLPDIYAKLVDAAHAVDDEQWGGVLRDRRQLTMRCAEYHTVLERGGLPIEQHHDYGSLVTMDLMLSHTSEFEGGHFQTLQPSGELQRCVRGVRDAGRWGKVSWLRLVCCCAMGRARSLHPSSVPSPARPRPPATRMRFERCDLMFSHGPTIPQSHDPTGMSLREGI